MCSFLWRTFPLDYIVFSCSVFVLMGYFPCFSECLFSPCLVKEKQHTVISLSLVGQFCCGILSWVGYQDSFRLASYIGMNNNNMWLTNLSNQKRWQYCVLWLQLYLKHNELPKSCTWDKNPKPKLKVAILNSFALFLNILAALPSSIFNSTSLKYLITAAKSEEKKWCHWWCWKCVMHHLLRNQIIRRNEIGISIIMMLLCGFFFFMGR